MIRIINSEYTSWRMSDIFDGRRMMHAPETES